MIRKHRDVVADGMGDSGTEGQDFTQKHNSYRGKYYQPDYPGGTKGGSEGCGHEPADERSQPGEYTDNDSGLRNVEDFQFTARGGSTQRGTAQWGDDIFDDVMANDRPRGDDNFGFDATGPIVHGVDKKQGK